MNKKIKLNKIVTLLAGASVLTGCTGLVETMKNNKEIGGKSNELYEGGSTMTSNASMSTKNANSQANFGKSAKNWVDPIPLAKAENKIELPKVFEKEISLTMPGTVSAVEIISEIQRSTGIKFKLGQDVYDQQGGVGQQLTNQGSSSGLNNAQKPVLIPDFVFKGSLNDALNLFASKSNLSWRWNGSEVEVFKYETKTYQISLLPGQTATSANVSLSGNQGSSQGGGGGGGGSSSNNGSSNQQVGAQQEASVTRKNALNPWLDIVQHLRTQLTKSGMLTVSESTGLITVKDTPEAQKRIKIAVDELNSTVTKQVFMNVTLYTVVTADTDSFSFNPTVSFAGNYISLGGNGGTPQSPGANIDLGIISGPWIKSNVMLATLSKYGKASIMNEFTVTTLNGQPAPISNSKSTAYVSDIEVTLVQGATGNSYLTSPNVSNVIDGVNMSVTPKIESDGTILMEYSMNLNKLEYFGEFPVKTPEGAILGNIMLPVTTGKSFLQRAQLKSGQTLVLSGFKQKFGTQANSGTGSAYNMLLGGSSSSDAGAQYVVITITPYTSSTNNKNINQ